ncbi:hypothetical protein SUGI_0057190 [Cryptomeria japonica]|uniref:membrane protein PM19L-like isoform X2 n=1 Tax=Cryptomeria japonica TaxID=3369 RepID=UPI002408C30F|nr:membrane protein PM19L-like isoform X2 [Cryptomeria japonica]GLJ07075.1 hypothetical protein SUGI_0057190 [Cryptomeria japonica]
MDQERMKLFAVFILRLNLGIYGILSATARWALDKAIEHEITTGLESPLPNLYWAIYFPMGNAATGFLIMFALIAGVAGGVSCLSGFQHSRSWTRNTFASATSAAFTAWGLTLLAMGLACKEMQLQGRNLLLKTVESFVIILSATQLLYIVAVTHIGIPQ